MASRALLISFIVVLILLVAGATQPLRAGQTPPLSPTEQWALNQLQSGQAIDFNQHCPTVVPSVDPGAADGACRTISGIFLTQLLRGDFLKLAPWPYDTIRISGAYVQGATNLTGTTLQGLVDIEHSSFDSAVILNDAEVTHSLSFQHDSFDSPDSSRTVLSLSLVKIGGNFDLNDSVIDGKFLLDHATIQGDATLDADRFRGEVDAHAATIGAFLYLRQFTSENIIQFGNAHIGATMTVDPTDAQRTVFIDDTSIKNNLYLEGAFDEKTVDAVSASALLVDGSVGIQAQLDGSFDLHNSVIKGDLSVHPFPSGTISLFNGAGISVGQDLNISGSIFLGTLNLCNAHVGNEFTITGDTWQMLVPERATSMDAAGISVGHDASFLNSMFLGLVDLSNAQIRDEFSIRGDSWQPTASAFLSLDNTHVGILDDDRKSWPPNHELDGFTYDALSGRNSGLAQLAKEMKWRLTWLPRNSDRLPDVAPDSYREFAAALAKAGDTQDSNRVLYQAQTQAQCAAFNAGNYLLCLRFFLLKWSVGYGIGTYTFRVVGWVALLTVLGAFVLRFSKPAEAKGTIWCLEASLDRLLPIVQLSPEFDEFFKDPTAADLKTWQITFFAVLAIVGWGLGLFLAAALSGLTQIG